MDKGEEGARAKGGQGPEKLENAFSFVLASMALSCGHHQGRGALLLQSAHLPRA